MSDVEAGAAAFDPLHGQWRVRHRRLQALFAGCDEWRAFAGTSATRPVLGGYGNVEDNWIDDPRGAYRAVALRSFDRATKEWRIWWHDERRRAIDPPVFGQLTAGCGVFAGSAVIDDRHVLVQFTWSNIGSPSPRWEQAFSPDNGAHWETNWTMDFSATSAT